MQLKVLTPTDILVDEPVQKIIAEALNGSFCLLPRHIDFVTALVPGLLIFSDATGQENYLALDEGLLVKQGSLVRISSRRAVQGDDLAALRATVAEEFNQLDDKEKKLRSSLARLEADVMRHFIELGGQGG